MNKRLLLKIKRPTLPNSIHSRHDENLIATAEFKVIDHKRFFILNIFTDKNFDADLYDNKRFNEYFPFIRIFFHKNEYITQDIRNKKIKWYTGKMSSILENFSFYNYNNTDTLYASDKTLRKAELFFNINAGELKSGKELYKVIRFFQNNILYEKLIKKHNKEFEEIDFYMKQLRELPKNFNKWIVDTALLFSRYIIYDYNKNSRFFKAYCTHCGNDMMLDSRDPKIRNNKNGKCPFCQSSITYKARKRFPQVKIDSVWCSIFQKTKDHKFVLRTFKADKIYCGRGEKGNYRIIAAELCRTFYHEDKYKCFENYYVPNLQYDGWYYDGNRYNCEKSVLYEKNIKSLIKGTPYQYSALDLIVKDHLGLSFEYLMYIFQFRKNLYWEYLVKLKLYSLLRSLMWDWYCYRENVSVNKEANSIVDILKLTKKEFTFLKEFNGDSCLLYLLQRICRVNKNFTFDEIKLIWDYHKKGIDLLSVCKYAPVLRITEFLEKQYEIVLNNITDNKEKDSEKVIKAIFKDWNEYLKWCDTLGYKLKGKRILFPPVFYTAHDIVSNKYADFLRKKYRARNKEIHFMLMDVLKEYKEYAFEYKDFVLVVPDSEGVFKKESRLLKHCVKNYDACIIGNNE